MKLTWFFLMLLVVIPSTKSPVIFVDNSKKVPIFEFYRGVETQHNRTIKRLADNFYPSKAR